MDTKQPVIDIPLAETGMVRLNPSVDAVFLVLSGNSTLAGLWLTVDEAEQLARHLQTWAAASRQMMAALHGDA